MFNSLPHPFDDIANFMLFLSVIVIAFAYLYSQWKSGISKSNLDALSAYRSEIDALKLILTRKDENIIKISQDISDLQSQLNQLKAENQSLRSVLSLRDPKFESAFIELVGSIKDLRDDFRHHYKKDKRELLCIKQQELSKK